MIKKLKFTKEGFPAYVSEAIAPGKDGTLVFHVEMPVYPGRMPAVENVEIQQNIDPRNMKWATVSHIIHEAVTERTVKAPAGSMLRLLSKDCPDAYVLLPDGKPKTGKQQKSSETKE